MKEPFNILDFPTVIDDTEETTVIKSIEKSKKKQVNKLDELEVFINKYHKISIEKYRLRCEELFP
jgi:hypothetical protein